MGRSPQLGSMGDTSFVSFDTTSDISAVFGRDMLFNMKKVINWRLITENKRKQIAHDNTRENTERIPYQYKVGDEVLCTKRGI